MKENIFTKLGDAMLNHPNVTKGVMAVIFAGMSFCAMDAFHNCGRLEGYRAARNDIEDVLDHVSDDEDSSEDTE